MYYISTIFHDELCDARDTVSLEGLVLRHLPRETQMPLSTYANSRDSLTI